MIRLLLLFGLPFGALAQRIDFSYAGYGGGGVAIPAVRAVVAVRPSRDASELLQQAIDQVSKRPLTTNGFRGAVLLKAGRYPVYGHLEIHASGVVLRGEPGAVIVAAGKQRRTLIEVDGFPLHPVAAPVPIVDEVVPAGGRVLTLASIDGIQVGDHTVITRPSTAEWIAAIRMKGFPGTYANQRLDWTPGSRNLIWDRTVEKIDRSAKRITLDAPVTTALEKRYGGATLARDSGSPLTHVGIELLTLESEVSSGNPMDEEHSWTGVSLNNVEDAWVRGVTARHFAGSAVRIGPRARRVTVETCRNEQPVSEKGGYRRQSFLVEGQQVLIRQCTSDMGMNDFAVGLLAAGPNVFLDSIAKEALGPSGSFESWASGVLYEKVRVEGAGIWLTDQHPRSQGGGWTAANSVIWNCDAKDIEAHGPEGAENVVSQSHVSLYETQLAKRGLRIVSSRAIAEPAAVPEIHVVHSVIKPSGYSAVQIVNGRLVAGDKVLWGGAVNDGWWKGQANPATALEAGGVALTRFVPGRVGPGLTEDLPALAARMATQGTPFYQSVPGLWYDRRRDEHTIVSRADGNVWAPFYEMPWARSGQGTASDGLSKFDLTQFNPWYYERLREFGQLCDSHGLVLQHNMYNTHNLLEIGPHWVDYPWRPANDVNDTGLPEPPPFEPGNHLHIANQVYDVSNPVRRALHRAFIWNELEQLGGVSNLFFSLGAQFAGPLSFQEFFQDTVAEWEVKTGRSVRIELATSKDITDAIMENPERARQVAIINTQYWQYRPDGSLWAAQSGLNLAFREIIAKDFKRGDDIPPNTTPLQVYRLVREYHQRYPDKAIVAWNGGAGPIPVMMAGGAEALMRNPSGGHGQGKTVDRTTLDLFVRKYLAEILMNMEPRDGLVEEPEQNWYMSDRSVKNVLIYSLSGDSIKLSKSLPGVHYTGTWFDPRTGDTRPMEFAPSSPIQKPTAETWLLLLKG